MNLFDWYADQNRHSELAELYAYASTQHQFGLAANFLEKDLWVTEVLRLLYDEQLLGVKSVAFKGGTALSKCWQVIQRFSEDIDLSIHWSELSDLTDEQEREIWLQSTKSVSQARKFRDQQQQRLEAWAEDLVYRLNKRFSTYQIDGLRAVLQPDSRGECVDIHFPRVIKSTRDYQLDHILLEFGGRNRGKPTKTIKTTCYLNEIKELSSIIMPTANVQAYQNDFILWEKLTALHQFCTQKNDPNPNRLARHWYDVACLLQNNFADAYNSDDAMQAVVEMKKFRWPVKGVDYEAILHGQLSIVPTGARLEAIATDHNASVAGQMFFSTPDTFEEIIEKVEAFQNQFNNR